LGISMSSVDYWLNLSHQFRGLTKMIGSLSKPKLHPRD